MFTVVKSNFMGLIDMEGVSPLLHTTYSQNCRIPQDLRPFALMRQTLGTLNTKKIKVLWEMEIICVKNAPMAGIEISSVPFLQHAGKNEKLYVAC